MVAVRDYYRRFLDSNLSHSPTTGNVAKAKVLLLLGARQTGKSTLLNHVIGDKETTFAINLQDRKQRRRYESDDGLLIRELSAQTKIKTVFIDEIQKVPALLDDIQFLYDQDPYRFRFFLTGSSARQLKRRSANLLPGRLHTKLLTPVLQAEQRPCELLSLSMGPMASTQHVGSHQHIESSRKFPARDLNDYLIFGNLPGLYQEDTSSWRETLSSYVELYIENEIRQEHIVDDMGAFVRFLRLAALEAGQQVNFTKLAHTIGVAVNTLRNFYQVLEDTHAGIRIPPFGKSRKRTLQSPRFLIFDIGVRHVLAELPLNHSLLKLDAGHIFEQWVLTELYYRCRYRGKQYKVSTWRTSSGAEVDAIIETPDDIIPVEVKWTENPSPRDAKHLETFLRLHHDRSKHGYVVCRCPHRQQLTDNVIALPWHEF